MWVFTILSQYQQNFTTIFRYDILIKYEEAEKMLENEENKNDEGELTYDGLFSGAEETNKGGEVNA